MSIQNGGIFHFYDEFYGKFPLRRLNPARTCLFKPEAGKKNQRDEPVPKLIDSALTFPA
jgi:hypothetical protein